MLTINLLTSHRCPVAIKDIYIPSRQWIENYPVPPIKEPWWIEDPAALARYNEAYYVPGNTSAYHLAIKTMSLGIRPAIRFSSVALEIDDEFILGNYLFRVITSDTAICMTIIGYSPYFSPKNKKALTYNNSDAKAFLDEWRKNIGNQVFRVQEKKAYDMRAFKLVSLFSEEELKYFAQKTAFCDLNNKCNYWTKARYDEFSGYFIDKNGKLQISDNSKEHNICPVVTFYELDIIETPLKEWDIIEFDGRLFRMITDCSALCLNTLGTSIYSNGLADIDELSEQNFFLSSEIHSKIKAWVRNN